MIKAEGLTKYYGDFCALNGLNLEVGQGQIFGYIGPNGAGKTTTIRILAALMRPTSGSCFVGDVDVTSNPRRIKEMVGYLPDFFGVYEGMRVYEYLDFFGSAFKIPRKGRKKRIDDVLEITGASYMSDIFVEALSRGMKQKVGIARTLIHDPSVLLLDEPLSGLDPTARVEMKTLLRRLVEEQKKTILVSSHILPELSAIADSVGIMSNGTMIARGPVNKVMRGLRQERLLEVQFLSEADKAVRMLKNSVKGGVQNISCEDQTVRFEIKASDSQLSRILSGLIERGFKIVQFSEVPVSLEEAFMEITEPSGR